MSGHKARRLILKVHLYAGLTAAPILACAALSGSLLAFRSDIDRWLNPALYRVAPTARRLEERELVAVVANERAARGAPAAIERIDFDGARVSQVFVTRAGASVFVDPYTGAILGTRERPTALQNFMDAVLQFHVRLLAGNLGQRVVDVATLVLALLIPSGGILWWDAKRVGIRRGATWRQLSWDWHNVAGLYAGGVLLALALSGVLLGWEQPLYWMVRATPQRELPLPRSTGAPTDDASPGDVDAWLAAADRALPDQPTSQLRLPISPRSAVQVTKRGPRGLGRSAVYVDRYDAHVLRVDDVSTGPRAYRAHVLDRALHTGEICGLPTRVLASLSSLALVVLAVTGSILGLKRIVR